MVRGTTAQFKFDLPYEFADLNAVKITFWQPGNNGPSTDRSLPIIKLLGHCQCGDDSNELMITLTEEETLRFSDKTKAYVQLRARTDEANVFASKQVPITVYPVYDDKTLDDDDIIPPEDDGEEWTVLDGHEIG